MIRSQFWQLIVKSYSIPEMKIKSLFIITIVCSMVSIKKTEYAKASNHFVPWYNIFKKDENTLVNLVDLPMHEQYYKTLSKSKPTPCTVKKSLGGQWIELSDSLKSWCEEQGNCETWPQMDGVKTLCMDKIHIDVISGSCLIYSFGLSDDWSFEEVMAKLGCKVRSFDPTIEGPPLEFVWPKHLSFQKIGISNQTEEVEISDLPGHIKYPLNSLKNIVNQMNDTGRTINVLKLDVEGYEFRVIPEIIDSSMIDVIDQVVLEVHSDGSQERGPEDIKLFLQVIDNLKHEFGFSIINYDPNLTMGRFPRQYYPNFDITLLMQQ